MTRFSTGTHRYTFLLFREPEDDVFELKQEEVGGLEKEQRRHFNAYQWGTKTIAESKGLSKGLELVGINFFTLDT